MSAMIHFIARLHTASQQKRPEKALLSTKFTLLQKEFCA